MTKEVNRLAVKMNHAGAGFFVYPQFVMNSIFWAESRDDFTNIPLVDFGEWCTNGKKSAYYDTTTGGDVFLNYFKFRKEPVCDDYNIIDLETAFNAWDMHNDFLDVECVQPYPYGRWEDWKRFHDAPYNEKVNQWYHTRRKRAWKILSEYFHLRKDVQDGIDKTWDSMFTDEDYVIGVHIRGTDKKRSIGGRKIPPAEYKPYIDHLINNAPSRSAKIFLATDDPNYFNTLNNMYPGIVHSVPNIQRSEKNIFSENTRGNNYLKGLEVLTDSACLSKCNFLIKCSSAVSEWAVYFNPDLHSNSFNLQYDCSHMIKDK